MNYPTNAQTGKPLDQAAAISWAKTNGTTGKPEQPRNVQAQSGSRKVLVTWDAPVVTDGIIGYKIYKDNENQLFDTITDPNVRQYSVPATAGSTPPVVNVFVSSFTKQDESNPVQVQGSATAESGAPADPTPPTDSGASGSTGKTFNTNGGNESSGELKA